MKRWLIVAATALALIAIPVAIQARPAAGSSLSATDLADRIARSAGLGWSGVVETSGTLAVPDTDTFAALSQLLGENNTLRVWWRSADEWRVDRLRASGETGTFRSAGAQIRWVFEDRTATISPVSIVRLPDAIDLLPATLARSLLAGATPPELDQLPPRVVAGVDAAGLRLSPADPASSLARIDIWADPVSGLPLRVELSGADDRQPVVTTTVTQLREGDPGGEATVFRPADGVRVEYADAVDVAAEANAFVEQRLPSRLAGLAGRPSDTGSVRVYGDGPTRLLAVPLRGRVAGPLRQRLRSAGSATESSVGVFAPVGPVGVLVTPFRGPRGAFLITGTVTEATLQRAATELVGRR